MIHAVLGGSFDPFHNGHLAIVDTILQRGLADHLSVVPAHQSPHKEPPVASAQARLRMAQRALAGRSAVSVLSWEADREGISYTVETLEKLAAQDPASQLRLVIGADNLAAFQTWQRPERILELAELLIFTRAGSPTEPSPELAVRSVWVTDFAVSVTATEVRARLTRGQPVADLVPAPVLDYILVHRLYGVASGGEGRDVAHPG